MALVASRFDVFLVRLDPVQGRELRKTRPCVVVSPDEMNRHIGTVIVAPMTTRVRTYPTRISTLFRKKRGQVALDQIRTIDRSRLGRRLGRLDQVTAEKVLVTLAELFAP